MDTQEALMRLSILVIRKGSSQDQEAMWAILDEQWHDIKKDPPKVGQLVVAKGTYDGELYGEKERGTFIGVGEWQESGYVSMRTMRSDGYYAHIIDVTHWKVAEHDR